MGTNKYDKIIIMLLSSLAFGLIGGSLQISRILAICIFPLLMKRIKPCSYYIKEYLCFIVFFMLYSTLSLLWSPNLGRGLEELVYFVIHFIIFLEILCFSRYANDPIRSISLGCAISILLTLFCAVWELTTDNHLSISSLESELVMNTGTEIIQRRFASVTFGNYNTYVTFLCFLSPFLFYSIDNSKNAFFKVLLLLEQVTVFIVVLFNSSRGGLICFALLYLAYVMLSANKKTRIVVIIFFCTLMSFAIHLFGDSLLATIVARSSDRGLIDGSSRFVIWSNAFRVFVNYIGIGTGIGGVASAMQKVTTGIIVPHNFFLEIFVEFGLIIGLYFCLFLLKIFKDIKKTDGARKTVLLLSFITLPVTSIINSTYLLYPMVFAYFASLVVFSRLDYIKSR